MTEPEDFLKRWSRRKREAAQDGAPTEKDAADESRAAETPSPAAKASSASTESETGFDLSKLPSLDSIGPSTDIRAFLQPGVPAALSRAALRRAWAADPGIRDFIGLAENAWDFTASDSMPGFGALDPQEAQRLLAQLLRDPDRDRSETAGDAAMQETQHESGPSPQAATDADSAGGDVSSTDQHPAAQALDAASQQPEAPSRSADSAEQADLAASQNDDARVPTDSSSRRKSHGRALPR